MPRDASGLQSHRTRTESSSFFYLHLFFWLGSSTSFLHWLRRWLCQAPDPLTGMHAGTVSLLWEHLALAHFSGCSPVSTHWASDSARPLQLHQSTPPLWMSWQGSGCQQREAAMGFWNWLSKNITTPLPISSGFAQFLPEDHTDVERTLHSANKRWSSRLAFRPIPLTFTRLRWGPELNL